VEQFLDFGVAEDLGVAPVHFGVGNLVVPVVVLAEDGRLVQKPTHIVIHLHLKVGRLICRGQVVLLVDGAVLLRLEREVVLLLPGVDVEHVGQVDNDVVQHHARGLHLLRFLLPSPAHFNVLLYVLTPSLQLVISQIFS